MSCVTFLLLKQNTNHFCTFQIICKFKRGVKKTRATVKVTGTSLAKSLTKEISERKQYLHDTVKNNENTPHVNRNVLSGLYLSGFLATVQ